MIEGFRTVAEVQLGHLEGDLLNTSRCRSEDVDVGVAPHGSREHPADTGISEGGRTDELALEHHAAVSDLVAFEDPGPGLGLDLGDRRFLLAHATCLPPSGGRFAATESRRRALSRDHPVASAREIIATSISVPGNAHRYAMLTVTRAFLREARKAFRGRVS